MLTVVEDLEVLEDRVRQLDSGLPLLPVKEFDLHPAPERFDDCVIGRYATTLGRRVRMLVAG